MPWERAGPSASTAGESSPPYPWGQSDSSVARTRRHPQALRFSVVTGLVTNTVMQIPISWIPVWIPASRACAYVSAAFCCAVLQIPASRARAECSLSKQPHARARIVPRTRGAFHRCAFLRFRHAAPARCGSQSPASSPTASRQGGVCRCGRSWRPQFAQHIAAVTRHKGHATSGTDARQE